MPRLGPAARAQIGANLLAIAAEVETREIRNRLRRFSDAHRRYLEAQERVRDCETDVAHARRMIRDAAAAFAIAIDRLAVALLRTGHSPLNPFRRFKLAPPARLHRQAVPRKLKAVDQLLNELRRKQTPAAVLEAAAAAEQAAADLISALNRLRVPQTALQAALARRDAVGRLWDRQLSALRSLSRAVSYSGIPLHRLFFAGVDRMASMNHGKRK